MTVNELYERLKHLRANNKGDYEVLVCCDRCDQETEPYLEVDKINLNQFDDTGLITMSKSMKHKQ